MSKPKRRRRVKLPANTYRACFINEAPRIGSGWRLVEEVSAGRKWARVKEIFTARTARLPASTWADIKKSATHVAG